MFLGIDIGTTAVKALTVNLQGEVMNSATAEVPSHVPRPGFFEQDAEEAWKALALVIPKVLAGTDPRSLEAAAFSSAMHGLMALHKNGAPLIRQMTWADGRAAAPAVKIRQAHDARAIYRRTGCPVQALYYPAKLAWLREERPEVWAAAAQFCSIKDFIIQRLTGRLIMDRSHASSHGLLDIHSLEWDRPTLDLAGIGPERLPELCSPEAALAGLTPAARELGLPTGCKIVAGGGDGGLANVGSGAVSPGQVAATIGTSGAMRLVSARPLLDPAERTWCYHLTDGAWYAGGAINSGGIVYRWVRDALFPDLVRHGREHDEEPYETINRLASAVSPGADGLLFLPYLAGERTPWWDPQARGVIFGLRPEHTRNHLARAALEGICMAMHSVHRALVSAAGEIREVRVSGGFIRSHLWLQILADVLGHDLIVPRSQEGSALGAAFLAMRACGKLQGLQAVRDLVPAQSVVNFDPDRHRFYKDQFALFEELYPKIKDSLERLQTIQFKS